MYEPREWYAMESIAKIAQRMPGAYRVGSFTENYPWVAITVKCLALLEIRKPERWELETVECGWSYYLKESENHR